MSAPSSISPETLITVKVTFDGNTRRFKLALKEVGPSVFQGKLRELLAIPQTQEVRFERFSDSAASYVTLDPQNTGVYKQLFRAAKAKLKLRIKATTVTSEVVPWTVAVPALQNDAASDRHLLLPPSYSTTTVDVVPSASRSTPSISTVSTVVDPAQLDDAVAKAVSSYCSSTEFTTQLRGTVREEVGKEVEKQQPESSDLINLSKSSESPLEAKPTAGEAVGDLITSLQNAHIRCDYAIYCNNCNGTIQGVHYHCDECDRGDYDLCQSCTTKGIHCYDRTHWLNKRDIIGGKPVVRETRSKGANNTCICNCCVGRFGVEQCVVCVDCKDFDLCVACLRTGDHGHDPRHTFTRAHSSMILTKDEEVLLAPGRGVRHAALCDSCDKTIFGIRHKCIDCPDWDYCGDCIKSAPDIHPRHRFVQIFSNDSSVAAYNRCWPLSSVVHSGIYCDGPLCEQAGCDSCIRGPRFKCAICPDTDFCAACEASPQNRHYLSHPLIMIKTPIRNVHVTTTDDSDAVMGDTPEEEEGSARKEDVVATTNTATQVQTIADVEPTEDFAVPVAAEVLDKVKEEVEDRPPVPSPKNLGPEPLYGRFLGDSIADGTLLPVGQEFTQTWYMKNTGPTSWPAGVTVKFSGGDYMFLKGDEDSLNATVTETEVPSGETAAFSVRLSATWPPGKLYISYWRLTAPDGRRFGDNIWCGINVSESVVSVAEPEEPKSKEVREDDQHSEAYSSESVVDAESVKAESVKDYKDDLENATENMVYSQASSEMVFPKLEVESPIHSLEHLPINDKAEERLPVPTSPVSNSSHKTFALSENGDAEEVDISSVEGSEGFMTDEEYDVLCASDEEFEECERV